MSKFTHIFFKAKITKKHRAKGKHKYRQMKKTKMAYLFPNCEIFSKNKTEKKSKKTLKKLLSHTTSTHNISHTLQKNKIKRLKTMKTQRKTHLFNVSFYFTIVTLLLLGIIFLSVLD